MKLSQSKEWYHQSAAIEGDSSVESGLAASHGSAVPDVGTIGEFDNLNGETCQCVVRGRDEVCLHVDYVHPDGSVVKNAMIGMDSFRPNSTYQPNAGTQRPATKTHEYE